MSAVTRPRGPLPARVYWFRRGMVLGVAFLLVFGIARVLGDSSDGHSDPGDVASVVSSDQQTTGSRAGTKPSRRHPASSKPTKTATPLPEPDGPCTNEEIAINPVMNRPEAGDEVRIRLELSSLESAACTWRVSRNTVVVRITSGEDFIWSSQDCPWSVPTKDVVVRSGDHPAVLDVTWTGRRSGDECSRQMQWADTGWYHVSAAALTGEPTDVQFELLAPSRPTVTVTVTPTPKSSPTSSPGSTQESAPTDEPLDEESDGVQEPNR